MTQRSTDTVTVLQNRHGAIVATNDEGVAGKRVATLFSVVLHRVITVICIITMFKINKQVQQCHYLPKQSQTFQQQPLQCTALLLLTLLLLRLAAAAAAASPLRGVELW